MVEHLKIKLGDIIVENQKSKIKVRDSKAGEMFPFFTSGSKISSSDTFLCDGNNLFIATGGKAVLQYYEGKAAYSTDCYSLTTRSNVIPKFLFYFLISKTSLIDEQMFEGAALRHLQKNKFRDIDFFLPPLPKQQRIVTIIDEAFAVIATATANAKKNLANARELFESEKKDVFRKLESSEIEVPLASICNEMFAGGDAPKDNFSDKKTAKFNIPIIANALKDNGLYGFTDLTRVHKPSITIAARGSGTGHTEIRYEPFFPIVRLIVLTPNTALITLEFLKLAVQNLVILSNGSAIPQLTIPMIKEYSIPLPTIPEQQDIVNKLDELCNKTKKLEAIYQQKLNALEELKKSILNQAFSGQLQ